MIIALCALAGAGLGWFAGSFGSARYDSGPRYSETMQEYNERFFNRGKIGAIIGAVVGAGFAIALLTEKD